jgi:hypothetical protein
VVVAVPLPEDPSNTPTNHQTGAYYHQQAPPTNH